MSQGLQGISDVKAAMNAWSAQMMVQAQNGLEAAIGQAEAEAKRNAPWTDRTGNARKSITGSGPEVSATRMRAALAIGMYYGVFLELSNGGKYRIVWPTVLQVGSRLPDYLRRAV